MQNFNPLLQNSNNGNRFITIGEIMLRLTGRRIHDPESDEYEL